MCSFACYCLLSLHCIRASPGFAASPGVGSWVPPAKQHPSNASEEGRLGEPKPEPSESEGIKEASSFRLRSKAKEVRNCRRALVFSFKYGAIALNLEVLFCSSKVKKICSNSKYKNKYKIEEFGDLEINKNNKIRKY